MRILSFEKEEEVENLKQRYRQIHPLIFNRSLERAYDISELFDILESIPKSYPFSWDEKSRRWKKQSDVLNLSRIFHD